MRTNRLLHALPASLVLLACLLHTASGFAGSPSDEARLLFREARVLASSGYLQAACNKFERSLQLEQGSGTEFNLADCWEKLGRTASARRLFLKVAAETKTQGQDKRSQAAMERADSLLTRLTRLQLQCASTCPDKMRVTRTGASVDTLDASSWLEPQAVDPGEFRVTVSWADGTHWATDLVVPNDPGVVVVSVPRQPVDASASQAQRTQDKRDRERPTLAHQDQRRDLQVLEQLAPSSGARATSAWPQVLLWVGVGGLALSGTSALWLNHKNSQASKICPANEGCTTSEIHQHDELVSDARLARVGVYAGLGLGLASFGAAGIAYYLDKPARRERDPSRASMRVESNIGIGGGVWGVAAHGTW